jgi:hypothetical protein
MLDTLAFGMSNIKGEGRKLGSDGSAGAMPRETRSEMKVTAGDVSSWNETDLVMPMVNDSQPRIRYAVFYCMWVVQLPSHYSLQLIVYNSRE